MEGIKKYFFIILKFFFVNFMEALYLLMLFFKIKIFINVQKLAFISMKDKLYKSKNDKIIFGVCAGVANYFETDPTIVRAITAILLVVGAGFILPLYIILAIILPENPNEKKTQKADSKNNSAILGAGFILIGAFYLLNSYNIIPWRTMWPALLIIVGAFMLWGKQKKQ